MNVNSPNLLHYQSFPAAFILTSWQTFQQKRGLVSPWVFLVGLSAPVYASPGEQMSQIWGSCPDCLMLHHCRPHLHHSH
ncbi:hypothetical protein DPMN_153986 [Dreissena polymorpha]|uniref:Uncharacterized protein n=1 Tax=Dreissena polymorpha TaxID=45954 RepID=A0A9D4FNC5_DREPO|nr:hypothetical protein DPMN_153986 [Dreissena polymorpha]